MRLRARAPLLVVFRGQKVPKKCLGRFFCGFLEGFSTFSGAAAGFFKGFLSFCLNSFFPRPHGPHGVPMGPHEVPHGAKNLRNPKAKRPTRPKTTGIPRPNIPCALRRCVQSLRAYMRFQPEEFLDTSIVSSVSRA